MIRLLLGSLALVFLLVRCGTSSDATTNSFSIAAPAIAITSPTATTATRGTSVFNLFRAGETDKPTELKPLGEMKADAKADFLLPPDTVIAKFGGFDDIKAYRSPCFGPSWTDNASGSVARPSQDLGIVWPTRDNVSTEACAAAQMNSLIAGKPHLFNKVRTLVTGLLAKANAEGKALPEIGASIEVTMPTVTDFTFTVAKLSRLANDADGNTVYKTEIGGTIGAKTFSVTLYHTPTNADNTEFKGLFQATMPYTNGSGGAYRALSVVYSQTATDLKFVLDAAANRNTTDTDFFDATTGRVAFTKADAGEDLNKMIATFDTATGASTVHFAWQAGGLDVASRDYAVTTTGVAETSTGVAYFGFGSPLKGGTPLTDSTSTMWATKMICDWRNNPGTPLNAKVQKQTMTVTGGVFVPTVSNINFAPHTSCNNASWNVTVADAPFLVRTGIDTTTNNLVAPGVEVAAVTAPTYTKP